MDYEALVKRAKKKLSKTETKKRFKVPEINFTIEGTKTIISNFSDIAKYLQRDTKHLFKFFLGELGVPGEIQGRRAIFTGKINKKKLETKLNKYLNYYIFCPKCKKPDTILIKEENKIKMKCEACGEKSER